VAAQLLKKNEQLDVAIVEPSEKHYYQTGWTLVRGGDDKKVFVKKDVSTFISSGNECC
jgi:sulfide:quinone oxidoreductase